MCQYFTNVLAYHYRGSNGKQRYALKDIRQPVHDRYQHSSFQVRGKRQGQGRDPNQTFTSNILGLDKKGSSSSADIDEFSTDESFEALVTAPQSGDNDLTGKLQQHYGRSNAENQYQQKRQFIPVRQHYDCEFDVKTTVTPRHGPNSLKGILKQSNYQEPSKINYQRTTGQSGASMYVAGEKGDGASKWTDFFSSQSSTASDCLQVESMFLYAQGTFSHIMLRLPSDVSKVLLTSNLFHLG